MCRSNEPSRSASELEDMAYDSIPILLLTIITAAVRNLSELLCYGLASLIVLAEKLNVNIIACLNSSGELLKGSDDDCVVCLCEMRKVERLRRLECCHVFHNKCLESWLKQLHFTCPLCRSPVPLPCTVSNSKMETGFELVSWFGFR